MAIGFTTMPIVQNKQLPGSRFKKQENRNHADINAGTASQTYYSISKTKPYIYVNTGKKQLVILLQKRNKHLQMSCIEIWQYSLHVFRNVGLIQFFKLILDFNCHVKQVSWPSTDQLLLKCLSNSQNMSAPTSNFWETFFPRSAL